MTQGDINSLGYPQRNHFHSIFQPEVEAGSLQGGRERKERERGEREREAERDQIYESVLFYNYSSRPIDGGRFETTVEHKQVNCKYTYDSNAEMILIMN